MMLVPRTDLLSQRIISETLDPILNKRLTLDEEVENILRNKTFPSEEEKLNHYLIMFNKYQKFKKSDFNIGRNIITGTDSKNMEPQVELSENKNPLKKEEKPKLLTESTIINYVNGKMQKRRTEKLLDFFKMDENLSWSANGNVNIDGRIIPGSNIIDIINDLVNNSTSAIRKKQPIGMEETVDYLKRINVPESFIANKYRLSSSNASTPLSKRTRSGRKKDTVIASKKVRKSPATTIAKKVKKNTATGRSNLQWNSF